MGNQLPLFTFLNDIAMKKSVIAFCIVCAATIGARSQIMKSSYVMQGLHVKDSAAVKGDAAAITPANGFMNEMNMKAARDFIVRFKNPTDVCWGKTEKGFLVNC